ncbi:uncharacterized protein BDR25DRAFT_292634 [Lindgomyces ingoldianus]|uniref:Uncharacterized protein n=1 Tax=Lindgomyces ingoldianus TaxID=673940 RepID=A0ACB6QIV5_9PLEO|nr:uncharacterized protein BDR25DRAFT_292634 [Lindgomyces ingoldianus]KAF2466939.1 hypothetical protein BDR25DRAFT_292634 [Lindgomyces ingoldianus]
MSSTSSLTPELAAANASQPLLNVCISFAILETFFIIAFLFSWYFNSHNTNSNNAVLYLIMAAYIFCIAGTMTGVVHITVGGAGYHADTLHPATVRTMLKIMRAHEIIYSLSIPFPKLAILCLYFRLFTSKISHYILYTTGFLILATFVFAFVSIFANCRPFQYYWDKRIQGHCTMDVVTVFRFYSIPNICTDITLLILPIPALWNLHVGMWTKIGLFMTFLISSIGIVTAVLRFVSILQVNYLEDVTYLCVQTTIWTVIEPGAYFVAATMPTLRPLVRRIFAELDSFCPFTHAFTQWVRRRLPESTSGIEAGHGHYLRKKSWNFKLPQDSVPQPSRVLRLDDLHYMQNRATMSPSSIDEESMLCAAAVSHEKMNREGRNPDGTLRGWSLQPIRLSPLRTSFYFA